MASTKDIKITLDAKLIDHISDLRQDKERLIEENIKLYDRINMIEKTGRVAAKEILKTLTKEDRDCILKELQKEEIEETKVLPINNPDFTKLIETCESVIKDIAEQGYSKDQKQWVYESAMECIYGSGCWGWINKHDKGY